MLTQVDRLIADAIAENGSPAVDAPPQIRESMARYIATVTNRVVPMAVRSDSRLTELRESGLYNFGSELLTRTKALEVAEYFRSRPVYNAHVVAQSDGKPRSLTARVLKRARRYPFGAYSLRDTLSAPHLLETVLSEPVLELASAYLGCTPTLYSLNSWWAFPNRRSTVTRRWHRDPDDYRFLALFFFLTDVDESGGRHIFIKHSHDNDVMSRRMQALGHTAPFPFSDHTDVPQHHEYYDQHSVYCSGQAGTAFLADTYGVHRAEDPSTDRLVCWARFGLHAGRSYIADETRPVPRSLVDNRIRWTKRLNFITRLLLQ